MQHSVTCCSFAVNDELYKSRDERVFSLRDRSVNFAGSSCNVKPIVHRSHLFVPMSKETPCVHCDVLWKTQNDDLSEKEVHLTIYDVTCRLDYDSALLSKIQRVLGQVQAIRRPPQSAPIPQKSLIRLFFSLADCNFDYVSPERFNTPSRMIARVGDFKVSSNLMTAVSDVQAANISLGDVSIQLCNRRFPYVFENSKLIRSHALLDSDGTRMSRLRLAQNCDATDVIRLMNNRSILSIETVSVRVVLNSGKSSEPPLSVVIDAGELCIFACKDSFSRFNNTVAEAVNEITALTESDLEELRKHNTQTEAPVSNEDTPTEREAQEESEILASLYDPLEDLRRRSELKPIKGTSSHIKENEFLLDGYDWTTIDADEFGRGAIEPGEEQAARWFGEPEGRNSSDLSGSMTGSMEGLKSAGPVIISQHFSLNEISDPLNGGDMGIAKLLGRDVVGRIRTRAVVKEFGIKLRFFDGYDWPELLSSEARKPNPADACFIIPEVKPKQNPDDDCTTKKKATMKDDRKKKKKAALLDKLLVDEGSFSSTFADTPLPEDRSRTLKEQAQLRRLARRSGKYFQVAASGISCRIDSMEASSQHRLASCALVKVQDFFLAETISGDRPVKMIGEWFHETEHPRDSNSGLLMIKVRIGLSIVS